MIVAVEIQREYTTAGRPYYLQQVEQPLGNCRRLFAHARANRWPVIHVRQIGHGHLFSEHLEFARFVEGFEPLPHESLFTKRISSCYSCDAFNGMMEWARCETVYLIGFTSTLSCLATVVEGYHRGHEFSFVADASLARATAYADEATAHLHATDIIASFAHVVTTERILAQNWQGVA